MTKPRHSWSEPHRPTHLRTIRVCWNCGLEKVTRHEATHWQEYWRDGQRIDGPMPPCVDAAALADAGRAAHG